MISKSLKPSFTIPSNWAMNKGETALLAESPEPSLMTRFDMSRFVAASAFLIAMPTDAKDPSYPCLIAISRAKYSASVLSETKSMCLIHLSMVCEVTLATSVAPAGNLPSTNVAPVAVAPRAALNLRPAFITGVVVLGEVSREGLARSPSTCSAVTSLM